MFMCSGGAVIRGGGVFVERCRAMIIRLQEVCPQLDTDGLNNIWIVKPGAKSRGRGEAVFCITDNTIAAYLWYVCSTF